VNLIARVGEDGAWELILRLASITSRASHQGMGRGRIYPSKIGYISMVYFGQIGTLPFYPWYKTVNRYCFQISVYCQTYLDSRLPLSHSLSQRQERQGEREPGVEVVDSK